MPERILSDSLPEPLMISYLALEKAVAVSPVGSRREDVVKTARMFRDFMYEKENEELGLWDDSATDIDELRRSIKAEESELKAYQGGKE